MSVIDTNKRATWTEIKALALSKQLQIQYTTQASYYYVFIVENNSTRYTNISITSPANSDQTDFETNYLTSANSPISDKISFANNATIDAFARLRVSNPETIFNSKQIFDNQPIFWDDQQTSGSGTSSVHSINRASSALSVSNLTAGTRVRQTKRRFNYQPGKSQLIYLSSVVGTAGTGITKRLGLFDSNNGVFFQQTTSGLSVVVRSSVTGTPANTVISQSSFNKDKLDGNGPSRITYLPDSAQIFFIDFEWLGTGRVRFGIIYRGIPIIIHEVYNSNESGITSVWMSTPNLPLRWEISNDGTGAASSIEQICSTVVSEGGQQSVGFTRSIDRGATGFNTANGNDVFPIISMRLKSGANLAASISQLRLSIINTTNADFRWALYLNPTIGGTDAASWINLTNSSVEYDISRNNTNILSGGTLIDSGYSAVNLNSVTIQIREQLKLGSTIAGVSDQFVLSFQRVDATTAETVFASMTFIEDL